ncbi:MAG: SEC-C metal-binding domain-containing protein [Bacteroidetes bacterium]|nr:SEC-C metal-binding domain-containing protein [Bacteroidota bacterium]
MPYLAFQTYFPEIAKKETRCIQIFNDPKLAGDQFILLELFCDEPKCDCRRVMLNILSEKRKKSVAVINYGWESEKYYENWFGKYDKDVIYELKGPSINILTRKTDITDKIFERVKITLEDNFYVKRIIEHYYIFQGYIENMALKNNPDHQNKQKPVGRNEPCPCGSGKKFKLCCLPKGKSQHK